MHIELGRLNFKIDDMRRRIKESKFLVQSPLMAYLTKTQYDYMNWYSETLEKRIKLLEKHIQKNLPS